MFYDYAKETILFICYNLLHCKKIELHEDLINMVGYAIGKQFRTEMVFIVIKDLMNALNNREVIYNFTFAKESPKQNIKKLVNGIIWSALLDHGNHEKQELAVEIAEQIFGFSQKKIIEMQNRDEVFCISNGEFSHFFYMLLFDSVLNHNIINNIFLKYCHDAIIKLQRREIGYYPKTFNKLAEVFELSSLQKKILFIFFLSEIVEVFRNFVQYTEFDFSEYKKAIFMIPKMLNISPSKIKKELGPFSKLKRSMLLEIDDGDISISNHIVEFLSNDDENNDIFSFFFVQAERSGALDINKHRVAKNKLKAIKSLVRAPKGVNLLLYGVSGTGKTEFSKSLGNYLNMEVYNIKTFEPDEEDLLSAKRSALMAANNMLKKNVILVVDEAEELLGSGTNPFYKDRSDNKAWLNTFMEEHKINIIWITNDMTMHSSTKRRFDLALKFESFTREQRLLALKNIQIQNNINLFSADELNDVAHKYTLDAGALSLAFKKMGALNDKRVNKKEVIYTLLNSQMKLLKGENIEERKLEKFYNPNFVNSSIEQSQIIDAIDQYYKHSDQIHNLCVLFQGRPGTGKTEYAKYISHKLERGMAVKRASDILEAQWGGTEKNIANMFKRAELDGDILFLDECDSLFKSRSSAEYSWMVSETNELLTQMERFRGVLICATNFMDNLDRAALRRFHLKVKFNDLEQNYLLEVYKSFFAQLKLGDLSKHQLWQLKSIKGLNPGDFRAVYNAVLFQRNITHADILHLLKEEVDYRSSKKAIGLITD